MSAPESSDVFRDTAARDGVSAFTRWPALLGLSLGVVAGPIAALLNQQFMYMVNMWACGRGMQAVIHIVPALCVLVTLGAAYVARRHWRAVGGGVDDEDASIATRTRFVAIVGIAVSLFSALVILAQWSAAFVFDPCMRA